jgi:hypothetical protein
MESSIKTLTITGAAASSGSEIKKSRRTQSRRKKVEDEDLEMPLEPVKQIQIEKTSPIQPISKVHLAQPVQPVQKPQLTPPVEKQEIKPTTSTTSVILNPPKVQRVKLQPKATHVQHIQKQVAGTRKARKISLSLSNLNHRFTRARRVHDDTQKKPIDSIRSYLVDKGVIQMKSKAPEKMLRSMYNDFNMLKDGQAL